MPHRDVFPTERFFQRAPTNGHFLFEGIEFPASKEDLMDFATEAEAAPETLNLIYALPHRIYTSYDDIWRAIAEATRVLGGGGRNLGKPRDDIGKQATTVTQRVLQP